MNCIRVGHPMDPATERGPLIHQTHFDKVIGYVGIRHDDGAVLATAGRVGDKGWFIRPSLFTGAAPAMRVAQEKVFAAFLTSIRFADQAKALRNANAVACGPDG